MLDSKLIQLRAELDGSYESYAKRLETATAVILNDKATVIEKEAALDVIEKH